MLVINNRYQIPEGELSFSFARSGGPGGQNVNKVSSKAILRWAFEGSTCLPEEAKLRLRGLQRNRITVDGDLIIISQTYRDQDRNKQDCLTRLREMILQALVVPKPRKKTMPSPSAEARRLQAKKHRAFTKQFRTFRGED